MTQPEAETLKEFNIRRMRAELLEAAARLVEAEAVEPNAAAPDPTDISYNMALTHAAEAIRRVARLESQPAPQSSLEPVRVQIAGRPNLRDVTETYLVAYGAK